MIKKLVIRNFQAHKKLVIEFGPHVTSIIGPSDIGKSAIIRAILWLATNRPRGTAFIREGTTKTSVKLLGTGLDVYREKGTARNVYRRDGTTMSAVGDDVPEMVTHDLNLSEVNFQRQHDSPFWFSETAGEVSRQLNRIVNLGVIDSTLANLAAQLRKANSEVDFIGKRLEEAQDERSRMKAIRDIDANFRQVEELGAASDEAFTQAQNLADVVEMVGRAKEASQKAKQLAQGAKLLGQGAQTLADLAAKTEDLGAILAEAQILENEAAREIPSLHRLENLAQRVKDATTAVDRAEETVNAVTEAKENSCRKEKDAARLAREWKETMGKTCPLCGQKIPSSPSSAPTST